MGVKRKQATIDVVQAARIRIQNVFDNGLPIYLAFSGGKDSLAMAHIAYTLIRKGKVDPSQLTIIFVDEEAIWPCLVNIVSEWRERILRVGANFDWYALELKHFNAFKTLEEEETFVLFDRYEEERWVRRPPDFAIRDHPLLRPRIDDYQHFLPRITTNGIQLNGVRVAESVQRLHYISSFISKGKNITGNNIIWPLYDWKDSDVWLYIRDNRIDVPDIYKHLYQIGKNRREMRLCASFSVDAAGYIVRMAEYYPEMMEAIIRREPAAYMAAMYWDSEMFRREKRRNKDSAAPDNQKDEEKDCKKLVSGMLNDIDKHFNTEQKRKVAMYYRKYIYLKRGHLMTKKHWRTAYAGLTGGDPKMRTARAIITAVELDYRQGVQSRRDLGEI